MTRQDMNVQFVYVSRGLKEYYVDPFVGVSPQTYKIIPNIIDKHMFPYKEKNEDARFHILSIRPYTAKTMLTI